MVYRELRGWYSELQKLCRQYSELQKSCRKYLELQKSRRWYIGYAGYVVPILLSTEATAGYACYVKWYTT